MGKIKKKFTSLKWSFFIYLPVFFAFAFLGSMVIGIGTNYAQEWYRDLHSDVRLVPPDRKVILDEDTVYIVTDGRPYADKKEMAVYFFISNTQLVMIPLWVILCVAATGAIFYRRELKKPITILLDASRKITENQLDFHMEYKRENELGQLCSAFEEMRRTLEKNNHDMWRSLEERKRLNSAFSHDLRTPLTVLKGYRDYLAKYADQIPMEKMQGVLERMGGQIHRLETYTYKMSAVQKLEDIVPEPREISGNTLCETLETSGKYLCRDKVFHFSFDWDTDRIFIDPALVSEVYENILSNGVRYGKRELFVSARIEQDYLTVTVRDDGAGFSENALRLGANPFYRGDQEQSSDHFGLGLYICRILCEKCGGSLTLSNAETGGSVTAKFFCKS